MLHLGQVCSVYTYYYALSLAGLTQLAFLFICIRYLEDNDIVEEILKTSLHDYEMHMQDHNVPQSELCIAYWLILLCISFGILSVIVRTVSVLSYRLAASWFQTEY